MNVILLFFIFLIIGIIFSKVKVELDFKQKINGNFKNKNEGIYELKFYLYLFNFIKIGKITIRKEEKKNKAKAKTLKFDKEVINIIKKLDYKISKMNLDIKLDTQNVILTSFIVTCLFTIISIIFTKYSGKINKKHSIYKVIPLYQMQNLIDIKLNIVFDIKIFKFINIAYLLFMKGRYDKNERKSYRESYEYCNE